MLISGCVQGPPGDNDSEAPPDSADETTSEPIVDMNFTTDPADPPLPTAGPTVTAESQERRLSIQATVRIPNSCHELRLDTVTATTDVVSVVVNSQDTSADNASCSSETAYASYSLDIYLSESLTDFPEKARLQHPIDETVHRLE